MARMIIGKGIDSYIEQLNRLEINTRDVLGRSIYAGADIVADAIKENIRALPVSNAKKRGTPENPISTVTSAQKEGLLEGFGISRMQENDGVVNVKIGFAGYNKTVSKTSKHAGWTNVHQANSMIARSVEYGTSFRKKTPFIATAIRATKAQAEKAMADQLDKEIEKAMK